MSVPGLMKIDMADMKPIEFESSDGMKLHGYLTLPKGTAPENLPVC